MLVKKYSLKTMPTNYIIWQTGLIFHFGQLKAHLDLCYYELRLLVQTLGIFVKFTHFV